MDMRHSAQLDKEARQHHRQGSSWNRYVALVLIVCLGLTLSVILFRLAKDKEQIRQQADFTLKAKDLADNIKQVLEHTLYEIDAMSSYYAASDTVERGDFNKFVQHLLFHNPALQTLAWIPRVTDSHRATYEGKARHEGHPDFQITENNAQGGLVRAGRRAEYYPMYFLEPYEGNEHAMGFDLASVPSRLEALTRARDTGDKTAASRIVLEQEQHDPYGFLIVTPIYRQGAPLNTVQQRGRHLQGFVLGVYRIDALVEKAIAHLTPSEIDIHLFDDSASADNRFLYFHVSQLRKEYHPPTLDEAQLKKGVHYAETINVAGRNWVLLFTPTPGSLTEGTSALPWVVLAFGVFITGFLAGCLWLVFARIDTSRLYTAQLLRAKEGLEHEIIERKLAEEALQKREAQLVESQRIAHIGSWERDVATNRVIWSDELYRIIGYDPHATEASYQLLLDCIHPDDRERFMKAGKEAVYENKPYSIDFRILRRDGTGAMIHSRGEVINNEDGKPVLFRGTVQDITERKLAEEKAASLARILETTLNELYIVDAETLRFLFVNHGARQNLGYSVEELRLMTPLQIKPELTAEIFGDLIEPLRSDKKKMVQFTTVHRRKDNSVYPVEVHLQRSVFKHIPVYVAIILDITERKKLEAQLRQAHKMEAVGQLAGGIAHDFNNILTAIIGYGSIMQMKMAGNDPLIKIVDSILASAQRAANLTQNLLAFSRKQVMQIQPVDMNKIVKNVYNLLSRIIGEDVELRTTLAPGEVMIQADRSQIEQVLMNLATNARDAMPSGGTLSIETSRAAVDTELIGIHESVPSGIYALLSISDTGEGLDEMTKKRIFDPFFTTKEVNKGTGLGLSIIYGIVKQHEGYISVDSVMGKGTTFRIYLPLCQPANKEDRTEGLPASKGGTETILYAEDDETIREIMEEVLTTAGYTVIVAHDGEDAVHKFIENKDSIRLLVLDVIMPKKSGKEAFDAIKQMRSNIKVLFISGYTADMIQKRGGMEEGVNFLYKPVSPNDLLQKVRALLR